MTIHFRNSAEISVMNNDSLYTEAGKLKASSPDLIPRSWLSEIRKLEYKCVQRIDSSPQEVRAVKSAKSSYQSQCHLLRIYCITWLHEINLGRISVLKWIKWKIEWYLKYTNVENTEEWKWLLFIKGSIECLIYMLLLLGTLTAFFFN